MLSDGRSGRPAVLPARPWCGRDVDPPVPEKAQRVADAVPGDAHHGRGHLQREPQQHQGCRGALRRRLHRRGGLARRPAADQPPLRLFADRRALHPGGQHPGKRVLRPQPLRGTDQPIAFRYLYQAHRGGNRPSPAGCQAFDERGETPGEDPRKPRADPKGGRHRALAKRGSQILLQGQPLLPLRARDLQRRPPGGLPAGFGG